MKRRDRERKQAARAEARNDPSKVSSVRKKKKLEMRAYCQRKKEKDAKGRVEESTVETKRATAAQQRRQKQSERERKRRPQQFSKGKKRNQKSRRSWQSATHRWRLRVQLQPVNDANDSIRHDTSASLESSPALHTEQCDNSPFSSRWSEGRRLRQVKRSLPRTPMKRARILQKLMASPQTASILKHKGVINNKETTQLAKVANTLIQSLRDRIDNIKPTGSAPPEKRIVYAAFKSVVSSTHKEHAKRLSKHLKIRRRKEAREKWWQEGNRKK